MPGSLPSSKGVQQYNFHFWSKGKRFPHASRHSSRSFLRFSPFSRTTCDSPSLVWSGMKLSPLLRSFSIRVEYSLWRATIVDVALHGRSHSSLACRSADTSEVMACALFENPPLRTILPRDDVIYHLFPVRFRVRPFFKFSFARRLTIRS